MNWKMFFVLIACFVLASVVVSADLGDDLTVKYLKINDEIVDTASGHTDNLEVNRGEDLTIKVALQAVNTSMEGDVKDVQVDANIYGYQYAQYEGDSVSDTVGPFDVSPGDVTYKTLKLKIPTKMDKDYFKLRITVGDRDRTVVDTVYELHVTGVEASNAIIIKDYTLTPTDVVAGRAFTAKVMIKNIGDKDLDDVKITVKVPDLGIQDSTYINTIDADESQTSEEMLLRVPECAKAGTYAAEITADFDEYEQTTETATITVLGDETCYVPTAQPTEKTIIAVPDVQDVGKTASVYPIMITNSGKDAKTFTLTISGIDWGNYRLDPSSVLIVNGGESKTVYLYVANEKAEKGEKVFVLTVNSGSESKQIPLKANIVETGTPAGWSQVKSGLEIGLVILVIILIIIGLIIGFSKLKGNGKKEEESQTYY